MNSVVLIVLIAVGAVGLLLALRSWRHTIFFVMFLIVFEGAIRKWGLPSLQSQIYFIKDAVLLLAIGKFLSEQRVAGVHEPLLSAVKSILSLTFIYCLLQIANPYSPSPLLGLLGLKSYLLYTVLMFMVPYAFSSIDDFHRKMRIYMMIMVPVALLGLIQFAAPPEHWLNVQLDHDPNDPTFASRFGADDRVRASSTFSFIGGYATFIEAMLLLSLAYLFVGSRDARFNRVAYALLTACTLGIFTAGSRSVVFGVFVAVAFMVLLCSKARILKSGASFRLLVGSVGILLLFSFTAQDAFEAYTYRSENSDDPLERLYSPISEMLTALETSPLIGTGIGTTANAGATIMQSRELWWLDGHLYELETARVMQEVGIVGFLLVFGMRIVLVFTAAAMVMRLREPLFKALSAAIAAFFLLHIGLFVINNPTAGIFYWFGAGLLFAMYRLDYERIEMTVRRPSKAMFVWPMVGH